MTGRLAIADIRPLISYGGKPSRAVIGERVPITAAVFGEGHDAVGASVVWTEPGTRPSARQPFVRMTPGPAGTDTWAAEISPQNQGLGTFVVEAWADPFSTWRHSVEVKLDAGQGTEDLANDLEDGARLLTRALDEVPADQRAALTGSIAALRNTDADVAHRAGPALTDQIADLLHEYPVRDLLTRSEPIEIWVDRPRALYGSWYEFFPRSEGAVVPDPDLDAVGPPSHGTFATAAQRLPAVAEMGFDVVYLPPIHPIGTVNRKGPNNSLVAGEYDTGSPWAIGSAEGGHDAIHPQLGTMEDFVSFVAAARELNMEVALDLALQCAPDHPWVTEHPEWFTAKPDGSIAYAENPPKKYQDIYPINFDNDPEGLFDAVLGVVKLWIGAGVKIFRVDNPHTKPFNFWERLIWTVKKADPDVLFLAEAFTRPAVMSELARVGFTQSYTYFTWRTGKDELVKYGEELVEKSDHMRPNFFVNTPDILHDSLQYGGPPMFKIRAVLASLISPSWGVYSGFELYEHQAVKPGSEEYMDSEKYQLRPRDWARAQAEGRSLAPYLTALNRIRREHPAMQQLRNLRFHPVDNPDVLCWSKRDDATSDTVIVVINLDSHGAREATVSLTMAELGLTDADRISVRDEITGAVFDWGRHNYVRLDPFVEPAHVLSVSGATS